MEFDYARPIDQLVDIRHDAPDAPGSPPTYGRNTIPAGQRAGAGVPRQRHQFVFPEQDELFVALRFRLPGQDWENQATGTKLFYVLYGDGGPSVSALFIRNFDTSVATVRDAYWLSYSYERVEAGRRRSQWLNGGGQALEVGPWHLLEAYFRRGGGACDGAYRLWLDGEPLASRDDVCYASLGPRGFWQVKMDNIWGGTKGTKSRDDHIDYDHLYISGAPGR